MEIMNLGDKKHTVTLPTSCVDPKEYKVGDEIEYSIKGTVKSVDQEFGTVVELSEEDSDEVSDDEKQDFESMEPEEQTKHMKKKYDKKNKLEEY